ncbi:MAG: pantetheine-phosphate adenylyltransferase [Chloroflexota bacterium]|nr:pantetheine-phosphate adenylyltransferase [Chloroflexota bacterium]
MTIAVYPGTFDPVHYGHIDIAKRAALLFEKVIIGIYERPNGKEVLFSASERLRMMRDAVEAVANVEVTSYSGLTVDFVRSQGATVVVRGLRVYSDFEYEYQMALMTRKLAPNVDMVCLMTDLEYAFLSSSLIKDVAASGGSVRQFVPPGVAEALQLRLQDDN